MYPEQTQNDLTTVDLVDLVDLVNLVDLIDLIPKELTKDQKDSDWG